MPSASGWQSVAYGGGVFVAVGNGGAVAATSPDGITWTQRALPVSATWTSVAYGGGTFAAVAFGSTIAATSPDGITWTQRVLPGIATNWQSVTYGGSTFAAVSQGSSIAAISTNSGVSWQQKVLPANTNWQSVAYGAGTFVAVASGSSIAATSVDAGLTWQQQAMPTSTAWQAIAYGSSKFVAIAYNVSIGATSPDGLTATWVQRVLAPPATSPVADVYKSPAASNTFGQDWYLILRRSVDGGTGLYYQVAEQYNTTTHQISNYGGKALSVVPTATTFAYPGTAQAPDVAGAFGNNAFVPLVLQQQIPWRLSVTANRVVVAAVPSSVEVGFYAGLYEDLLPAGVTQFPLGVAPLPPSQVATSAIGGGNAGATGGFTREPGATVAATLNFEARIHNGYWVGAGGVVAAGFTPMPTTGALYGNGGGVSRVMIGSARSVSPLPEAVRGLLIGCVSSAYASVAGDTLTVDGKTYVRFAGPVPTYGIFVDQSL
jgi:hypothetical protein